jgi:hypothetical protein
MKEEHAKLEQNQREKPMSFMAMVIITGFVGGVLWSGLAYLAYVFNLTEIHPRVILEPWAIGGWKKTWLGTVISLVFIGIVSIGAAIIYYALLRKIKSIFAGAAYGIALFLLVFFVLNPIFPGISPLRDLDKNTIIASVCFYILYGIFVGFSISYEENEIRFREDKEKEAAT